MDNQHAINWALAYQILKTNRNKTFKNVSRLAKLLLVSLFLCVAATAGTLAQGTITEFKLINSSTDKPIQTLTNGAVLNLTTLPTSNLNIRALTGSTNVGSVIFTLTGAQIKSRIDNQSPYSLQGDDNNSNYYIWNPPLGNYTLTAQPYSGNDGTGTAGAPLTITFSVVNQAGYVLQLTLDGSGVVAKSPDQLTYAAGSNVTLTAIPDSGYQFSGWGGDMGGNTNPLTVPMNSNKTITAYFTNPQYHLTISQTGTGTVSQNPDQAMYENGANVTLTALPGPGYIFSGWSGDTSSTLNPFTISITGDKNLTAAFTASAQRVALNLTNTGNGTTSKTPDSASYPINSVVQITATPDSGFTFSGWSGDASGNTNPLAVTLNGNKNIIATFSKFSPSGYCGPNNSDNIGCFVSVKPVGQTAVITYPSATHTFQLIAKEAVTPFTDGSGGKMPGNFDFAGYVPKNGSSKDGYISLNHEKSPGQVSILNLRLNDTTLLWQVNAVRRVNFKPVVKTSNNCAGTVTPWGTVITSEETYSTGDANNNGYQDVGWQVEIDPATGLIPDYAGDGSRDKLWALGRMSHENLAIAPDRITAYQTEDGGTRCIYKFVADQPNNLSSGTLYVLRRDTRTSTTGQWIQVPNNTKTKKNTTSSLAASLGGTDWQSLEEIEIGRDGKLYFGTPKTGTIWRFKDDGMTVSEIEAWVTRQSYPITYNGGVQNEDWGVGVDNLAFDGDGNLWVMQDKGHANLWVVRPDHTPANPKVELFLTTPDGAEPTGLTFTPDFRYGFLSLQGASTSSSRTLQDAAGNLVRFNQDVLLVFANKKYLGSQTSSRMAQNSTPSIEVFPNPFNVATNIKIHLLARANVKLEVYNMFTNVGQTIPLFEGPLEAGQQTFEFIPPKEFERFTGIYLVRLQVDNKQFATKMLHVK